MEASPFICRELGRLDPGFRLAWAGRPRRDPNELNPGGYALVSLARAQDIGPLDNPLIPNELWNITMRADRWGKPTMARIDRGPIFRRDGAPGVDWDPVAYVPVYVALLGDYGMDNWAVQAGAVLPLVRVWQTSAKERRRKSAEAAGRALVHQTQDLAKEAHRRLMYEANKPTATSPVVAWKHAKKDVEEFYRRNQGLENYYDPTKDMRRY